MVSHEKGIHSQIPPTSGFVVGQPLLNLNGYAKGR
jgi:hypothetical protein